MGEVYKAHDTKLDRPVAVKLLPPEVASDTDRLRRFHAEARAVSLSTIQTFWSSMISAISRGSRSSSASCVEGETLRQQLDRGALPVRDIVAIASQIASALAAAHARGIVHRDIKPENVMRRPDGYVKVLDFGLAKLLDQTTAETVMSPFATRPASSWARRATCRQSRQKARPLTSAPISFRSAWFCTSSRPGCVRSRATHIWRCSHPS